MEYMYYFTHTNHITLVKPDLEGTLKRLAF